MKQSKTIFKILIVFLIISQNVFAGSTPIPGIGIVVKRNNCLPNKCKSTCNHGGAITLTTGTSGSFSMKLEVGEYELSFPQDQLQTSINGIVEANYPKSNYQYNGYGVELVLDNSLITVISRTIENNRFAVNKKNSITITVPKEGAVFSGKLIWNDVVMTNSKICPEGFTMQNGECIPNNISGNQQARTEGKLKGKIVKSGDNGMISFSLNANGGMSSSLGVDTGLSFNPSLGMAIYWKNFGIGLDAGTFSTKPNLDFDAYSAPLRNLDWLNVSNSKSNWSSVYFLVGPHYVFSLSSPQIKDVGERVKPFHNKITLELAFEGGITMVKAPEFSVTDNSTPQKTIASYKAPDNFKSNVLTLKPSIKFAYWISNSFAITANAQYLMQSGQEEFMTGYRDLSGVNFNLNPQEIQSQIIAAPKVASATKGPEKFMSFGFGITYSIRKGWDGSIKGKNLAEKGINENGLKKNALDVDSDILDNKGMNPVNFKISIADSEKKDMNELNKVWTCPCCKNEFAGYIPSHEAKCCDLKVILSDVNRSINENDDVTFLDNVAISLKSNKASSIIPSQIALVYKIKQDEKGKLFGIPSIIFGIDIPKDSIPNYTLGCNTPCAVIGIAGKCGGFCYRLLPFDFPPKDYGPSEGPITFNPNSTGTIVFIKDDKLTSIELTNINSVKYTISTMGKINTAKLFSNPNFCYTYIEGFGTIAFEHVFSATCDTASNFIKELYSKTHKIP